METTKPQEPRRINVPVSDDVVRALDKLHRKTFIQKKQLVALAILEYVDNHIDDE